MLTQLDQLLDAIKADYGRWSKNLTSPRQDMIDDLDILFTFCVTDASIKLIDHLVRT